MKKPCPTCQGDCSLRQTRRDEAGRYEVREMCMTCVGWGFIEDPPPPPIGCPKVPL